MTSKNPLNVDTVKLDDTAARNASYDAIIADGLRLSAKSA